MNILIFIQLIILLIAILFLAVSAIYDARTQRKSIKNLHKTMDYWFQRYNESMQLYHELKDKYEPEQVDGYQLNEEE